jgi:hypothetical protein
MQSEKGHKSFVRKRSESLMLALALNTAGILPNPLSNILVASNALFFANILCNVQFQHILLLAFWQNCSGRLLHILRASW